MSKEKSPFYDYFPRWIKLEAIKHNILTYGDFTCEYCKNTISAKNIHYDHKVPLAKNGKSNQENIVIACQKCNNWKKDKDVDVFLKQLPYFIEKNVKKIEKKLFNNGFILNVYCQDCIYKITKRINKGSCCKAGIIMFNTKKCSFKETSYV